MNTEKRLKLARRHVRAALLRGKISYATMAELVRWLRRMECQTQTTK